MVSKERVLSYKTFNHQFVTVPKLEQITAPDGKRVYQVPGGQRYSSVTTFLHELPNKALTAWKKNMGIEKVQAVSRATTKRGKSLHSTLEGYIQNQLEEPQDALTKHLFNQVLTTINGIDNVRLIEKSLYSHKLRLAGTPDVIADYSDCLSVIDFKTSTEFKKENWITGYYCQAGAYSVMYEELFGQRPQKCVIIVAIENGNIPQVFQKSSDECFQMLKEYAHKLLEFRKK